MDLFKGYIETKNKKCIEKFKDRTDFKTIEDVKKLSEYAGILAEDVILVDVDEYEQSEILFKIVKDLNLKCRIYKTTRGKHFLFKNSELDTCKTHTKIAIGLTVDIKVGRKNSYEILKFNNEEREVLYDSKEYEEIPKYLYPVKSNTDFLNLSDGDGRNQALFNYILTLQSYDFTEKEIKECLKLINTYVLKESLSDKELEVIYRDDSFKKQSFYKGNSFQFDVFATYMVKKYHILKINGELHTYNQGVYVRDDELIERLMISEYSKISDAKRKEVLKYIRLLCSEDNDITDTNANYIAFKNGIYNLKEDKLEDFNPNYIITNKINHNYNPSAKSEICENVLRKVSCNDNDLEILLKEIVGYCFYRYNELGKAFILTGDGANGKSTFSFMIECVLGSHNISALDLSELGDKFKTAQLCGKLANIGDDIKNNYISDLAVFKKLVTGDKINGERKGKDPFDFRFYGKLIFSANDIPRVKDDTGAVLRRLIIVPFNAKFSSNDSDFDPDIKRKLASEESIEYLIIEGIKGLKRVLEHKDFTKSKKVETELIKFNNRNNPINEFLEEYGRDNIVNHTLKEVYLAYCSYCQDGKVNCLGRDNFKEKVCKKLNLCMIKKRVGKREDDKKLKVFCEKEGLF